MAKNETRESAIARADRAETLLRVYRRAIANTGVLPPPDTYVPVTGMQCYVLETDSLGAPAAFIPYDTSSSPRFADAVAHHSSCVYDPILSPERRADHQRRLDSLRAAARVLDEYYR